METVYKVEVVSRWVNISPRGLEKIIKKAIEDKTMDGNVVQVKAERKV